MDKPKLTLLQDEIKRRNELLNLDLNTIAFKHAELSLEKPPERINVIEPILCEGGIMMIQGETGVGKSHFMLGLAYAIATGGNFLKYKIPIPKKIIYFDGELGERDLTYYIHGIAKTAGHNYFPDNLIYFCYDKFPDKEFLKFSDPANREMYLTYIIENEIDGIVIDNLATTMDIDENNGRDWKPIQAWLLKLRALNKFAIFVHHAGSDKTKDRGITARKDVLNTVISLQKVEAPATLAHHMKVVYQKNRHFWGVDSLPFEAIHNEDGSWRSQDIEISNYELVISYFKLGATGIQIAQKLNMSPQMISKYKLRAIAESRLIIAANGKILNE